MEGSTGADALQSLGGDGGRGPAFGPVVDAEALVGQGRAGWNPRAHGAAGAVGGREEGRAGGRSALTNKGGTGLGEVGEAAEGEVTNGDAGLMDGREGWVESAEKEWPLTGGTEAWQG